MKKMMWVVSVLSLAGTVFMLKLLPDQIPMHYDLAGNIDRWGSKYESLIFPGVILLLSLLMTVMAGSFEKKARETEDEKESAYASSNAWVIRAVGAVTAVMLTALQGFILYDAWQRASGAAEPAIDLRKIAVILIGLVLVIVGNFMSKTRENAVIGVRLSWSMYNDVTWRKTNGVGALALMTAGILTIIAAVTMKNFFAAILCSLALVTTALVLTVFVARKVYEKEVEADREESDGSF